jgi:hypothetical protein
MGQPIRGLTPDRSRIRPKSLYAPTPSMVPALLMPGLCLVSVKGIQAAALRRSDPPVTELAPLSPRGMGADDPHPSFRKGVTLNFRIGWAAALR